MKDKKQNFSTKIINNRFSKPDVHGAISLPVYRNSAFEFPDSESIAAAFQYKREDHTYSRISNPSIDNFESKIKVASNAENVISVSSGMAAIANTFLTVAYSGSNIVTSPHLFGNTFSLFKFTLAEFGVETRFVNTDNIDEVASAVDENTCAFFAELITNPHLEIANFPEISKIMKKRNVPVILDTTVIPWCGFDAGKCGIDIEVVSTTKYISGGATGIGGAIIDYGTFDWSANKKLARITNNPAGISKFMHKMRTEIARNIGSCMSPDTASQQALGMELLQLRYEKMSEIAWQLAQYLQTNNKILNVNYPKLDTSPYKKISDALFVGNPGAMLTVSLKDKDECFRFMDRLQVFRRATNLFDNKSLVIHPESTIYGTFSREMKAEVGIEPNLIRISAGLENIDDLINDIENAL
ncbi:MAG: PLP-dependent transferase [Prevotellaceae bacterium]|jgi:O-acetylhomoserine (thiol)-lyase|nr:PLP-dependent transferase [Prevotellaceae bacterium]